MHDSEPPHNSPDSEPPWPPAGTGRWMLATVAVGVMILLAQLAPFDFAGGAGPFFALRYAGWLAVAGQVALFMPLGFVETQLAGRFMPRAGSLLVLLVALDGLLLSLIGETVQHWLPARTSSAVDVAANTLGTVIGYKLSLLILGLDPPAPPSPPSDE